MAAAMSFLAVALLVAGVAAQCPPAPTGTVYSLKPSPYLTQDPSFYSNFTTKTEQPAYANTAPDIDIAFAMQHSTTYPEQVALFPATRNSTILFVQWVIPNYGSTAPGPSGTVRYGLSQKNLSSVVTVAPQQYSYALGSPNAYTSGYIYRAPIGPLLPSKVYYYSIDGATIDGYRVTIPFKSIPVNSPTAFTPLKINLVADVGQTGNSSSTLWAASNSGAVATLFAGDLNYADHYGPPCVPYNGTNVLSGPTKNCAEGGLRWDSFFRLAELLFARMPTMFVPGNHELEVIPSASQITPFVAYDARVPAILDNKFPNGAFSEFTNPATLPNGGWLANPPHYYAIDIGPTHVIGLSSYDGYTIYTNQYRWLQDELCSLRAGKNNTPWLIVMQHAPWYNTDTSHYQEGESMRLVYESWLYNATVDLVVSGHVHAYERSYPVYDYKLDTCGPVHVTVGDGGNSEGIAGPFLDPQPYYSAFREYAFGHAELEFHSATDATYTWLRNYNGVGYTSDQFNMTNKNYLCGPKKPTFCPI